MIGRTLFRWLGTTSPDDRQAADINRRLKGYPRNHNYVLRGQQILPSRRLRQRWAAISPLYPSPLGSFLDIGSSKGFFVMQAALNDGCPAAVGIDVHKPFVDLAQEVSHRLQLTRARFFHAGLDEVVGNVQSFGGPFHTVQLISTYHYLYWGSALDSKAFGDHEIILQMLSALCERRLIFASPLEVDDCPTFVRRRAASYSAHHYTAAAFLSAAQNLFDVRQAGFMDRQHKRPLLQMVRRG